MNIIVGIVYYPLVAYLSLTLIGIACFNISIILDKGNIDERKRRFEKRVFRISWLVPFMFFFKLLTGGYKKN